MFNQKYFQKYNQNVNSLETAIKRKCEGCSIARNYEVVKGRFSKILKILIRNISFPIFFSEILLYTVVVSDFEC